MRQAFCSFAVLVVLAVSVEARPSDDTAPISANPQRPSFTTDTSVAAPGTVELELGGATTRDAYNLPISLKVTPTGAWPQGLELNFSFDGFVGNRDVIQLGHRLNVAGRKRILSRGTTMLGVSPFVDVSINDSETSRLGGMLIATQSFGAHGLVANVLFSAPTTISRPHAPQAWTTIVGYSLSFGVEGRMQVFAEFQQELPRDAPDVTSLMQGFTYRLRPDLVLDIAIAELGVGSDSGTNVQFLVGMTKNLGRFGRR